jgi:peptidase M28-like protein
VIDATAEIEALVEFEGRGPGTDAERRAAAHLAERLERMGRGAETEQIKIWPRWAMTYAVHAAVAIIGSVLSVSVPVIGAGLALLATILTFLDANGMALTTRRLLGRRASQNVVSPEGGDKGGRLVIVAHSDAGRTGLAYLPWLHERRAALGNLLRRPIGPFQPLFYGLVWVLVCCLIRLPGIESTILTVIQFFGTVLLILALPFLLDTAFAHTVPGANDNASGVATAMRLAEHYGGELEHFDLDLLLTGAEEALALGMRSHLKRHKGDLDPERVVFLNVEEVGRGTVRFTQREGLILPLKAHAQLLTLCEEIAEDQERDDEDDDRGQPIVRPITSRSASDAFAARAAGFPAITITCKGRLDYTPGHHWPTDTPERIDDDALDRAYEFCCELVERLDATVGPDLTKPVEKTLLKEES